MDYETIGGMIGTILIFILIAYLIIKQIKKERKIQEFNLQAKIYERTLYEEKIKNMPYKKKLLLTKNEWAFYKSLKPIADELGYSVLAKIRVADLVEVISNNRSEWQTYFNKINKKHIDFVLSKPENLQIVLLIELDDNTHNAAQEQRDKFIEELYKQTGYKLLRTRGSGELKKQIENILNPISDVQNTQTSAATGDKS